jgi:hypothetical protein
VVCSASYRLGDMGAWIQSERKAFFSTILYGGAWRCVPGTYMNSACIVCIAGGLEGLRPSKKNPRMHALLQEIILYIIGVD